MIQHIIWLFIRHFSMYCFQFLWSKEVLKMCKKKEKEKKTIWFLWQQFLWNKNTHFTKDPSTKAASSNLSMLLPLCPPVQHLIPCCWRGTVLLEKCTIRSFSYPINNKPFSRLKKKTQFRLSELLWTTCVHFKWLSLEYQGAFPSEMSRNVIDNSSVVECWLVSL